MRSPGCGMELYYGDIKSATGAFHQIFQHKCSRNMAKKMV